MGVGGCYQPGVYVPLKALFLVFSCEGSFFILAAGRQPGTATRLMTAMVSPTFCSLREKC